MMPPVTRKQQQEPKKKSTGSSSKKGKQPKVSEEAKPTSKTKPLLTANGKKLRDTTFDKEQKIEELKAQKKKAKEEAAEELRAQNKK
jgi:hypothetical protein